MAASPSLDPSKEQVTQQEEVSSQGVSSPQGQQAHEFDNLKRTTASDSATVHGVVASLSPMKKGRSANYFEGRITDGDTEMRLVGFRDAARKKLVSFQKSSSPVSLEKVTIKRARDSSDLELLLNNSSNITHSPKKFKISPRKPDLISLEILPNLSVYTEVNFKAKVIDLQKPEKISNGLTKQEVIIADLTAAARLTIWESDVATLTKDNSYYFKAMSVRSFKNEKYLTKPRDGASIEVIEDIGDVATDNLPQNTTTLHGAEIIGIQSLQSYSACISCNSKVTFLQDSMAQCTKCSMIMPSDRCKDKVSARLYLEESGHYYNLSAFDDILKAITKSDEVTAHLLLGAKPTTLTYMENVIISVEMD